MHQVQAPGASMLHELIMSCMVEVESDLVVVLSLLLRYEVLYAVISKSSCSSLLILRNCLVNRLMEIHQCTLSPVGIHLIFVGF